MKRELIEKRNLTSKTFDNGDGTRTVSLHQHPIHYGELGDMKDIDITLLPGTGRCSMDTANYSLHIIDNPGVTRIKFGKKGEWIEFEPYQLRWVNDEGESSVVANFDNSVIGVVDGNEITWKDAFGEGIDLLYGCGYGGIYKKVILSDFIDAPEIIKSGTNAMLEVVLKYTKSPVKVKVNGIENDFKEKQRVRLEKVRFGDLWEFTLPRFGDSGYMCPTASSNNEDIGGRTITSDEVTTGAPYDWLVKAIYPAFIDTDINEQIVLGTDDCGEVNKSYVDLTYDFIYIGQRAGPHGAAVHDGGFRWQTVNIPNGTTINSAKLSLYMTADDGTLEARILGIDEDDTATWSSGSRPSQRSKTSAIISANEADWSNWATDSWIDIDISTIIKEIIDRASWSANNDLAVVIEDTEGTPINEDHYISIRTYEYTGNAHGAKLDVTYGVAAGVRPPRVFYGPFHGPLGGPI